MNNYDKIKNLTVDEMAAWLRILCITLPPEDVDEDFEKWLLSEYEV